MKAIWKNTDWSDPVDALSVYAYVARFQDEVVVKDKRKKDDANEDSLKRPTRLDKGRQQTILIHEETIKDAPSTLKGKGKTTTYKLQFDIEATTY